MHKAHPHGSIDNLFKEIEEAVGPPEAETEEERNRRHEVMAADAERRKKRHSE